MDVQETLKCATGMQPAWIHRAHSCVPVTMDSWEMGPTAQVGDIILLKGVRYFLFFHFITSN